MWRTEVTSFLGVFGYTPDATKKETEMNRFPPRTLRQWRSLIVVIATLALVTVVPRHAFADHEPADKIAGAASGTIFFTVPLSAPTGTVILREVVRNSDPADLLLMVSLECGLFTTEFGPVSFSEAAIKIWVEIDGVRVPVSSTSEGTPTDQGPIGEVTFCDRLQFNAQASVFDVNNFVHSNAFNWVKLNVGAGLHTVEVKARLDAFTGVGANATAAVRRRTIIIEPTHMSTHQDMQPLTP